MEHRTQVRDIQNSGGAQIFSNGTHQVTTYDIEIVEIGTGDDLLA